MRTITPSERIALNIRAEMARRRVSQTTLGVHLGLKQASISARLRGKTPFNINELHDIADFLRVPLATLLAASETEAAAS